jgi:nitroimidazol reductase NimA-like FMN-containing flavoprotein (pyridoxamine 5'-phosphate oxidase superfamily)
MPDLHELRYSECEALLRAGVTGRVAFVEDGGRPVIVPVNYAVVDNAIVIRTSPYGLLGMHARGTAMAFEVDQFDYTNHRGWSVLARGTSKVIKVETEIEEIRRVWEPQPWAGGSRTLWVRLRWDELTGRRIGEGWDPLQGTPVRRAL